MVATKAKTHSIQLHLSMENKNNHENPTIQKQKDPKYQTPSLVDSIRFEYMVNEDVLNSFILILVLI